MRVPWTARRSNKSILKEINPEYSVKGLMLKLKLQYFGHLMCRTDSLEKTDAGKYRREKEKAAEDEVLDRINNSMNMKLDELWEMVRNKKAWLAAVHGVEKSQT